MEKTCMVVWNFSGPLAVIISGIRSIQGGSIPPAKTTKPSKKPTSFAFLLYIGEQTVVL
jgi:hypothetical protein